VRYRPKLDANQQEIVKGLRAAGCRVLSLASVGGGCPDLLVGRNGRLTLLEVKDGSKPPSARRLTADEVSFGEAWKDQVEVVTSLDDALRAVGARQG
jgi:Holliday junction resolvase